MVRELSLNPWSPEHPHFPIDAPHEFYSPYTLMLGLFCRASGFSSITILCLMGVVNLCLLLYCLRLFCLKLVASEATAFFTLLFTLVLWGYNPWMFSQFYHLAAIGNIASYPCCFAAALTFLIWAKYIDVARSDKRISFVLLGFIMVVVFLSHPPTGIVMYVGLFSLWLGLRTRWFDDHTALLAVTAASSVIAVFLWPYYRFTDMLFLGTDSQHHDGNRWMYVHILRNTFAALVGVPFLLARFRKNRRDPVSIMAVILLVLYAYGYFSHRYVLGRVIPYIVFCLHFALADWYGGIAEKVASGDSLRRLEKALLLCITPLVVTFVIGFFAVGVYRYRPGRECTYTPYLFLQDYVAREDVVLTDLRTSCFVPSIAGKLVATLYPQTFVKDNEERCEDVRRFLDPVTENKERCRIVRKYDVDYILVDKQLLASRRTKDEIGNLGQTVFSNDAFLLVNVTKRQRGP